LTDLDVFTRQYIGTSLQEKNGIDSTFLGTDEGDNSTNDASSESLASQSVNGLNDEESSSADDVCIDSPVEDRFTGDERHLIIYRNQYMQYQEKLYDQTYGINCLNASSFENMVYIIMSEYQYKFKPKLLDNIPIYLYWIDNHLSRSGQQDYLDLLHNNIRSLRGKTDTIPRSVGGVKNMINRNIQSYSYATINILWPSAWNMASYKGLRDIEPIALYFRDPMELISELFVNPEIMFKYKEHVLLNYYKDCKEPHSESFSNLMSSRWCRQTEELIKSKHQDGHILPLIFYLDGVHLNGQAQNKLTPVMCTTGNFSDELINKDIAKCVIGYLPTLIDLKAELEEHLYAIYESKTRLVKEWQRFELLVEREFWKEVTKGINKHWETGVSLHVLGIGIKLFYPCIAFFVSDDPQQHRNAGIEEGNCIHGCIQCTYSYRDGVYDEELHFPRNVLDLRDRCSRAEATIYHKSINKRIAKDEESNLKYLKSMNVHPFLNPMLHAPLGAENNIYTATPPDTLHLFCAGLMKSLVKTIITIIYTISKLDKIHYSRSCMKIDQRIINFEYVNEEMPHVHWTRFNEGIMCHVPSTIQDRGHSTGSFGGYRSTSFISLLIQLFYSIGNDYVILPKNFMLKNTEIDIQNRVLRAIRTILEVYFDVCRSEWNLHEITLFEKKVKYLYAQYMLVWDLNQSLLALDLNHDTICKQRNPHKIVHLCSVIKQFGSLRKCDSATWERFHQKATTSIWRGSSKRRKTLTLEMLKRYYLGNYSKMLDVIARIHFTRDKIIEEMKPIEHFEYVQYLPMKRHPKIRFRLNCDTQKLTLDDDWQSSVSCYEPIDSPAKFQRMIFDDLNFVETIQDICGINWTDKATLLCYDTFFLGAIKYISDTKSIGEGKLIASPKIPQKYDYALVKVTLNDLDDDDDDRISLSDGHSRRSKRRRTASAEDDEEYSVADDANNSTTTILVKLLLFFGMSRFEKEDQGGDTEKTHLFCIVQELYPIAKKNLMKSKSKRSKIKERSADILLGKPFQWACHPRIRTKFNFHLIPVEAILRPVFVVPEVSESYNRNKPKFDDVFYMLDRVFFDRSGWNGEIDVIMEEFEAQTADDERDYLLQRSLGNLQIRKGFPPQDFEKYVDDVDEEESNPEDEETNIYFDYE